MDQPIHNDENRELNVLPPERKRRKRKNVDEKDWSVNKSKAAREKRKSYCGKKLTNGKRKYDIPREGENIKPRCKCNNKDNSKIKCTQLSEDERKTLFNKFWKISWSEKSLPSKFCDYRTHR